MPLKPYSICQLSLLSISVCLSFPSPVRSTELSLKNTYPFSQQDLTLQESLRGQTVAPTAPLDVVLAQDSTVALPTTLQSPLPFALDTPASLPDAPAAGSDTAASPELMPSLTTEVTETPSKPLPNHSSFLQVSFTPRVYPSPKRSHPY